MRDKFAQVQFDEGTIAWLPHKWIKAWTTVDAYERLHDPSFDFSAAAKADLPGLFDDIVRAIDPLGHYTNLSWAMIPSNGRRAAGLLSARTLIDATEIVVELYQAAKKAKLFDKERKLKKTGDEFSPAELSRFSWAYKLDGVFIGLFGGLVILAHHESARRGIVGADLLGTGLVGKLRKISDGAALCERATSEDVLVAPDWGHDHEKRAEKLGLPVGSISLIGTGF